METTKKQTGVRLSPEAQAIIGALRQDTGLNTTAVIELAIRDLAKARSIDVRTLIRGQNE